MASEIIDISMIPLPQEVSSFSQRGINDTSLLGDINLVDGDVVMRDAPPEILSVTYDTELNKDTNEYRIAGSTIDLFKRLTARKVYDACDVPMTKIFGDLKIHSKESASDTIILLGKIKYNLPRPIFDNNIVVKLSFESKRKDNSLEVELEAYKLVNQILSNKYSPNLLGMIAAYKCDNFFNQVLRGKSIQKSKEFYTKLLEQMVYIEGPQINYNLNRANILILERANGASLKHAFENYNLLESDIKAIYFQLLYTLSVMSTVGLQHNDLHINNIFIDTTSTNTPKQVAYIVGDNIYIINTRYVVKIYDFDQASIFNTNTIPPTNKIINTKLDIYKEFCQTAGICNTYNPKFDIFLLLSQTYIYFKNNIYQQQIVSFIERHIRKVLLTAQWGFPGRLCNLTAPTKCDGPFTPSDKLMSPVNRMLDSSYFTEFRHLLSDYYLDEVRDKMEVYQHP